MINIVLYWLLVFPSPAFTNLNNSKQFLFVYELYNYENASNNCWNNYSAKNRHGQLAGIYSETSDELKMRLVSGVANSEYA